MPGDYIFVVGSPRSGTTLLAVLLDRHSRICVTPETAFFDEFKSLNDLRTWPRVPELKLSFDAIVARDPKTPAAVLATMLDLYAEAHGKTRCGEKTPHHLRHVPTLMTSFPRAKVVCMLRDERDATRSLMSVPWFKGNRFTATLLWKRTARRMKRFAARYPDRFTVVRYEELVANPTDVMTRVMHFLGEQFEPSQLDTSIPSDVVLPRSMAWKGRALGPIEHPLAQQGRILSMSSKPLPPGREGLPLLGETLAFAKNPFAFIDERLKRHGRIFRSRVLGRDAVVIAGPEAAGTFIDSNVVERGGSMPPHVQEIFGGRSLPLLDGDVHRGRKSVVVQAFTRAALTSYLPAMQASVERFFGKWTASGEFRWLDEMKALSIEVICRNVLGMQPGAEMDRLRDDYDTLTRGFATLPINLPGTTYHKALKARDRIFDVLHARVRERRAQATDDGLSRILAAAGTTMSDRDIVLELHHIVIAGFIVFAEFGGIVQQLTAHADVRAKLAGEIQAKSPAGAITLETLMTMPYLLQVVNEVKRLCPIIPAVFGKTKEGFEVDCISVPAGWMVMWAVTPSHVAHGLYDDPQRFDPDRFSPERSEEKRHEQAFAPQGAGPAMGHRCPGLDYATYFMEMFAVVLLRGYTWQLPPQNYELDYSQTPPVAKDGLRARVMRK